MSNGRPPRVLIAGGGVAGLEAVLASQALAGDRVTIELLAHSPHFTYRPLAVTEPFVPGATLRVPLAAFGAERNVRVHRDALARVRWDDRVVETISGAEIGYDALVLALGGRVTSGVRGAITFRGAEDAERVRSVVEALRQGTIRRLAFVVPVGTTWTLPVYELALQAAAAVAGARLSVLTPEPAPLAAFGPAAGTMASDLLAARGIELRTGVRVEEFTGAEVLVDSEEAQPADRVIALPRVVGPHPRGVPCDALGFVEVDEFTRVLGVDAVHAVGDVAAQGVKQGGLAAQQADVAAAAIAAAAGAPVEQRPYAPVLRGVLLTGDGTRYLRREGDATEISDESLWWPPAKIVGRHLGPYLAAWVTEQAGVLSPRPVVDRN